MIYSMTAFGSARLHDENGSLNLECRSVNGRFLDVHMRLPDSLRTAEAALRQIVGEYVSRGKLELRVSLLAETRQSLRALDEQWLEQLAQELARARRFMPDISAPGLLDMLQASAETEAADMATMDAAWLKLCTQACHQAMSQLQDARQREGRRLATMMRDTVGAMQAIVGHAEQQLPELEVEQQNRIAQRIRQALDAASPDGFTQISGTELSARIAQEAALFALRNDIAEELARLRSHFQEAHDLLAEKVDPTRIKGSIGKRLDFLCQEMNREANTLGSKSAAISTTHAAIELKLLIEQLREQVQNIE